MNGKTTDIGAWAESNLLSDLRLVSYKVIQRFRNVEIGLQKYKGDYNFAKFHYGVFTRFGVGAFGFYVSTRRFTGFYTWRNAWALNNGQSSYFL